MFATHFCPDPLGISASMTVLAFLCLLQCEYEIQVQLLEIYNEQLRDLLDNTRSHARMDIRNTERSGLNVPDAIQVHLLFGACLPRHAKLVLIAAPPSALTCRNMLCNIGCLASTKSILLDRLNCAWDCICMAYT